MNTESSTTHSLCALLPEGNSTAVAERYRDYLRERLGYLPGAGLLPVVPLAPVAAGRAPEPPRLTQSLLFGPPRFVEGSLFLPLENPEALHGIAASFESAPPPEPFPLFPLFPGLYIARIGTRSLPAPPPELERQLRCSGFRLALIEYRLSRAAEEWWDRIEERRIWEVPVRKPRAGGWSKDEKTDRLAGYE